MNVTRETAILEDVPLVFHSTLMSMAYESGHAYGEAEVLSHLQDLVSRLAPVIRAYELQVQERVQNPYDREEFHES